MYFEKMHLVILPRFQYPFQYPFPVPPPWNEQADNADVKAERKLMRLLWEVSHARAQPEALSRDPTNFRGLVLGCIEAKFCK